MRRLLDTFLLILVLLAVWQGLHWLAGGDAMTSPMDTFKRGQAMLGGRTFWPHAIESGIAFGYSLLLSVLGGLAFGFSVGLNRTGSKVAEPILVSVYSLPKVTLYPVILLLFGLGLPAKVAFGTIHGIIPIAIFSMNAVSNLPNIYLRTARAMRLTRWQIIKSVIVPAAIPEIATGLRIGFSLTVLGVLIGEMFASQRGLGYLIMNAIGLFDTATMMVVITLLAVFAVTANVLLLALDRYLHHRVA